jgi:hypothetical protein
MLATIWTPWYIGEYAGAGLNVCYTAFAGVALNCPVAMRCSRLLLSRTQGGVTNIRACT